MNFPLHYDMPPLQYAHGQVRLPGSKSLSNRGLLLSGLSAGRTLLRGLLDSEDTQVMLQALQTLGCTLEATAEGMWVQGIGGQLPKSETPISIYLANAGTAMRPLTAALALMLMAEEAIDAKEGGGGGGGMEPRFLLTGNARMQERPIADLVTPLQEAGCAIRYTGQMGYPPLALYAPTSSKVRSATPWRVRGDVSSQFLTALLMALPLCAKHHDQIIEVEGDLISKPYIALTLHSLQQFGIHVEQTDWQQFRIPAGSSYQSPSVLQIESDASSASYFIALGALGAWGQQADGSLHQITIQGLGSASVQGDVAFVEAARQMGASIEMDPYEIRIRRGAWPLKALDLDCNAIPDAAMTLAVMALYADGPSTLRNIASWRVKETDRLTAMRQELTKLGAIVDEQIDSITITPPTPSQWQSACIHTYDDHRMAMCFALAGFNPQGKVIRLADPKCVQKTFPQFFDVFFSMVHAPIESIPVLCVDGPTASGKGTLSQEVARQLGFHWLDSGALYRLLGLYAMQQGVLSNDPTQWSNSNISNNLNNLNNLNNITTKLTQLAEQLPVQFMPNGVILLDGMDVTQMIRQEKVGMSASFIAPIASVRQALLGLQRRFRRLPGLVADGRDMGTVVFPDAPLKVFLTASAQIRAERRYKQLISHGISAKMDDLLADLEARDKRDTERTEAPLKPARDAKLLDNATLSIEDSVTQVLSWWLA